MRLASLVLIAAVGCAAPQTGGGRYAYTTFATIDGAMVGGLVGFGCPKGAWPWCSLAGMGLFGAGAAYATLEADDEATAAHWVGVVAPTVVGAILLYLALEIGRLGTP